MNRVDFHEARQLFHSKFGQHPTPHLSTQKKSQNLKKPDPGPLTLRMGSICLIPML